MSAPTITYKEIKVSGTDVTLGGQAKISFQPSYNSISVKFSSNVQLMRYQIWITKDGDEYGVGVGQCASALTNVPGNTDTTASFTANATLFPNGDGLYRVGLYAQSSLSPYEWDATYLFMTSAGQYFVPAGSSGLEVWVAGNQ